MSEWNCVATCVYVKAREVEAFDDSSRQITWRTFRKHAGKSADTIRDMFGKNPSLASDWSVSFYRGVFRNRKCLVVMHSGIHHFFLHSSTHTYTKDIWAS